MSEASQVAEQSVAQSEVSRPSTGRHKDGGILASVQWLAGTMVIAIFAITFALQAFQIPSQSMENTLLIGDYLLVDKVHFAPQGAWGKVEPYTPIKRGDIVVFRFPLNPSQHFVKRVIGLPGDHIYLVDKRVYVNGRPLRELYVTYRERGRDDYRDNFPTGKAITPDVDLNWWTQLRQFAHAGEIVVPQAHYFVLGDNRDQSLDSRYWGFVPRENIIGRPLVIYWSLRQPEQIDGMPSATESLAGKAVRFIYIASHVFQETRWNRTLRIIK